MNTSLRKKFSIFCLFIFIFLKKEKIKRKNKKKEREREPPGGWRVPNGHAPGHWQQGPPRCPQAHQHTPHSWIAVQSFNLFIIIRLKILLFLLSQK
jgi:hypothetical protein